MFLVVQGGRKVLTVPNPLAVDRQSSTGRGSPVPPHLLLILSSPPLPPLRRHRQPLPPPSKQGPTEGQKGPSSAPTIKRRSRSRPVDGGESERAGDPDVSPPLKSPCDLGPAASRYRYPRPRSDRRLLWVSRRAADPYLAGHTEAVLSPRAPRAPRQVAAAGPFLAFSLSLSPSRPPTPLPNRSSYRKGKGEAADLVVPFLARA
jgi:hypothetical protein